MNMTPFEKQIIDCSTDRLALTIVIASLVELLPDDQLSVLAERVRFKQRHYHTQIVQSAQNMALASLMTDSFDSSIDALVGACHPDP